MAGQFILHVRAPSTRFSLGRRTADPAWDDEAQHRAAFDANPALYALSAADPLAVPAQRTRILFQLLERPRTEHGRLHDRVTAVLLDALPPDDVLTVFLALRKRRANHKHTARWIRRWILDHPDLEDLAVRRRQTVVDCLEHALGRDVMRGCAERIARRDDDGYVQRHLLQGVLDGGRALGVVPFLYKKGRKPRQPDRTYVQAAALRQAGVRRPARKLPTTITPTNRGELFAALVHLYRGGKDADLERALDGLVADAAAHCPRFAGRVAIVLDTSHSTRGYGEREFACVSQSVALRMVIAACCADAPTFPAAACRRRPQPGGATDLAGPLLDALDAEPDLVVVISDGYENRLAGDLGEVVRALPRAGVDTPVVFCHAKFTDKDDLGLRRPGPGVTELGFWHQDDLPELLASLFSLARGEAAADVARSRLLACLAAMEKELRA